MPELLGPTFIFDTRLGEAVDYVDLDYDEVIAQLRMGSLSDETIDNTIIEFKASTPEPEGVDNGDQAEQEDLTEARITMGQAFPRKIVVYLGDIVTAALRQNPSNPRLASVATSMHMSKVLVHETEHLRQYEADEETTYGDWLLPHDDRPWEQQAIQAEDEYTEAFRRHECSLLGEVDLVSSQGS